MNKKTVQDYMTPFPHTIGFDQPTKIAIEMMRKYGVRHLPVQDGGKLVGVLSERDISFGLAIKQSLTIEDVYTSEPYVVAPQTALSEVADRMAKDRIGCAIVADGNKLVGIFTATDACRVLAELV